MAVAGTNSYAADNDSENPTYIIGHWNYESASVNPVYVVSDGEDVELFINGISNGHGRRDSKYLFTFDNVIFEPGILLAVSYDSEGKEKDRYLLNTAGVPAQVRLSALKPSEENQQEIPEETVILCEVTDFYGKRCLADDRMVILEIEEPAAWSGIIGQSQEKSKHTKRFRLHNGENRISVKTPVKPGSVKVTAKAEGLAPTDISL